jgi:hypothetical protein
MMPTHPEMPIVVGPAAGTVRARQPGDDDAAWSPLVAMTASHRKFPLGGLSNTHSIPERDVEAWLQRNTL